METACVIRNEGQAPVVIEKGADLRITLSPGAAVSLRVRFERGVGPKGRKRGAGRAERKFRPGTLAYVEEKARLDAELDAYMASCGCDICTAPKVPAPLVGEPALPDAYAELRAIATRHGVSLPINIELPGPSWAEAVAAALEHYLSHGPSFPIVESDGDHWLPLYLDYSGFDPEYRRVDVYMIYSRRGVPALFAARMVGEGGPGRMRRLPQMQIDAEKCPGTLEEFLALPSSNGN